MTRGGHGECEGNAIGERYTDTRLKAEDIHTVRDIAAQVGREQQFDRSTVEKCGRLDAERAAAADARDGVARFIFGIRAGNIGIEGEANAGGGCCCCID